MIWITFVCLAIFLLTRSSNRATPRIEPTPAKTFAGNDCTSDCSGHEAGYRWAEEKEIQDEDDCETAGEHSDSPSFAEGCKSFVNGDSPTTDDDKDNNSNDDSQ